MDKLPESKDIPEKPKRRPGRPAAKPEQVAFKKNEARARAKLDAYKGNVEKLLFQQIRAFEWAQEAWIRSMTRAAAAKQEYLTREDAQQGLQLATMLEKLVETQGKFLREQKAIGARLTEDELIEAAVKRIMGIDNSTRRRDVLRRMVDEHTGKSPDRGPISQLRAPGFEALKKDVVATDAIAALLDVDLDA